MSVGRRVSIVVPVLDGADFVPAAATRILRAVEGCAPDHELVFVDDGSSDATWAAIERQTRASPRVRGLRLAENVGQARAIAAGFGAATGSVVVTIDVDLEALPEDIPLLVAAVDAGADLASGRRTGPRRLARSLPSAAFNRYVRHCGIELHDLGCGMNAMTADVASAYRSQRGIRRGLPKAHLVLLAASVVEVPVRSERSRTSRLGPADLVNFWLDFCVVHRRCTGRSAAALGLVGLAVGGLELRTTRGGRGPGLAVLVASAALLLLGASVRLRAGSRATDAHPGFAIVERTDLGAPERPSRVDPANDADAELPSG